MKEPLTDKPRFTVNLALTSIFTGLWVALNLTVAPISFSLTHLPVIHSMAIFFTLVLVVWATNNFGSASFVGIIGSAIVLLAGGPLPVLGFVPAAILFDLLFLVNHHKITSTRTSIAITAIVTVVSAFVAALANGFLILNLVPLFTLTIWAGLVVAGGIIGATLALPIIRILETAQVKKMKTE